MIDPNRLCLGCMNELEEENRICKICGWNNETDENNPHQLKCGTVLQGKYLVGKVLGEGGFGITYLGYNLILQEKVAIKEFYPHGYVGRDTTVNSTVLSYVGQEAFTEKAKDGFIREAKTMQSLNKVEGIVEMKDVFSENQTVYIVMGYVEGQTLKEYVKENGNKLPMSTVLKLLEPVMNALEQVHAHNLIHRDISPDNIMVSSDGRVTLLDLGAARQISADGGHSLTVNVKHGYAPMEQYQTHGEQGPWTDIYALCATIYRLITGKVPPNAADRALEDNITKPSVLGADISEEQEEVLLKGLAVRSSERYLNVFELIEDFEGVGKEKNIEKIVISEEVFSVEDKKDIEIKDKRKSKDKGNNKKFVKIAVAVVSFFLIAGVAFFAIDLSNKNKLEKSYNSAMEFIEQEKYDEAIAVFKLLGDYKDSKEQIVNCEYLIAESKYQEEIELEKPAILNVNNVSNVVEAKSKNVDVVGWIYIPGLDDVNSAVCQDKETKTYSYNKRNELGEQLNDDEYWIKGSYYTHFRNTFGIGIESLSKNTVIFGHSDMGMTNLSYENDDPTGPRFSQLFSFKDPMFARNTPYFYFSTDEKDYVCEIFSVFYNDDKDVKILSSFANYYKGNMGNLWYIEPEPEEAEYKTMLEMIRERSIYDYDVDVSEKDRIITLSTSTVGYGISERERYRFVIVAKIIEDQEEARNEFASFKINVNAPIPNTYEEEFKNYITYWDSNIGEEIIVEENKCGGRIYSAFTDIENGKYRHFLKFELYGTGVHTIKCGKRTKTVNLDEYTEGYKGVILWDTVECIVAENGEMSAGEHSGEIFYPQIACEECGWVHETIGSWR